MNPSNERTQALMWQEKLFPRRRKRILDDEGKPTNQEEIIPPTLCEICLNLRSSCNGAADPWSTEFLSEVVEMLQARAKTWLIPTSLQPNVIDNAVLQMVHEAIRIGKAELLSRTVRERQEKTLFARKNPQLDQLIEKINECDGQKFDCVVLGYEECRLLARELADSTEKTDVSTRGS